MTDRPDKFPEFAILDIQDPITGQPNVSEPPQSKKNDGWLFKEVGAKPWFNWLHRLTYLWLEYIDERLNKPETYTIGTLPSASTSGAGSMTYVTDDIDGATLAFSDGIIWRRVRDSAPLSLT